MRLTLAALVVVLLCAGTVRADSLPSWADAAVRGTAVEPYGDAGAVVLMEEVSLDAGPKGRTGRIRRVTRVLDEDGIDAGTVVLHSYSLARHRNVRIWVRSAEGAVRRYVEEDGTLIGIARQRFLDDQEVRVIAPPGVEPGAVVAFEAAIERSAELPQDRFDLQGEFPVARWRVEVRPRRGWDVRSSAFGAEPERVDADEGMRAWEIENLPGRAVVERTWNAPVPPEAFLALDYVPPGGEAPLASWSSVVSWLSRGFGLGGSSTVPRPADPDAVERALAEIGTRAREIRYFSVALGIGGFVPRSPDVTRRRGLGDCKDKTVLMIDDLRDRGIPAFAAVVMAPSDGFVPSEVPSPFSFNHVVVAIPWPPDATVEGGIAIDHSTLGRLRLYDPTLDPGAGTDASPILEGGAALILHPSTTTIDRIPVSPPESHGVEIEQVWSLDPDGTVDASFTLTARGRFRDWLSGGPAEVAESVRLLLAGHVDEASRFELEPRSETFGDRRTVRGTYRIPVLAIDLGELRMLDVGEMLPFRPIPTIEPDEPDPVYLPFRGVWRHRIAVRGAVVDRVESPAGTTVENPIGRVHASLSAVEEGVELSREFEIRVDRAEPDAIADLEDLDRGLRAMEDVLLLPASGD